ncbi:WD-40 repeat-containing protein [Micromonospora rhizosphaerae]|uniref:WD-40 repeat-containing protein n=1 Tax=Micromonospora rhizosphaerae TaxID=568872 RepID=A0A1C6SIF7_9ACTN|nr:TIR domain-containing protein [Micromonospora rhizosphaerae]SCL29079.1 WD-40 repeat-containing protein [Micromonospora rhizosphaerae]
MSAGAHPTRSDRPIDFFISYSPADERWATWLAWEFEAAGYRTMLQAWDFVAGTNFIDFMDRGVREAAVVVAVLSERYLHSTYGKLEWQAALRADPDGTGSKLVTVRVEDCPVDGLLATITYVDLVGVTDPAQARARVLDRIREALNGRAKPVLQPAFPHHPTGPAGVLSAPTTGVSAPRRRAPINPPPFPPAAAAVPESRSAVTVLQVAGPRFGRGMIEPGAPVTPGELQEHLMGDLTLLMNDGVPRPDLLVVAGNLTESGSPREFSDALSFLTGLRVLLGLEPHRLVVVPGPRDVTMAASRAYFATCEADDVDPQPPYWPKWRHYARLFDELYQGLEDRIFDSEQPWTLFGVPDLRIVVAGLNSTVAITHREEDRYGILGEAQATWFAQRLRHYQQSGWLRLGAMAHAPGPRTPYAEEGPVGDGATLRDRGSFHRLVAPMLNLLLTDAAPAGAPADPVVPVSTASRDGRAQVLRLAADGMTRWVLGRDDRHEVGEPTAVRWPRSGATFGAAGPAQVPDPRQPTAVEGPTQGATPPDVPAVAPPVAVQAPVVRLLDRLAEVCEARHDRVLVRRVPAVPPHLFVTYRADGVVRQQRVGAHVGTPTADDVDQFARRVHATDPDIPSELVYDGDRIPRGLAEEAQRRGVRVLHLTEFQGLLDLREYVGAQTARLQADRLYPPEQYVPQRYRYLVGADQRVREDVVEELLELISEPDGRFALVLGDFGRGKTFALREVARRLPTAAPDLIPILVELRALDKAHSVDGLVAAHLANHGEQVIDLKAFRYMLRQGRIVLLFDGFDELVARVTYDRAADHLETLLQAAEGNAKIVVSSRTQHFKTNSQVLTALGERVGLLPHRRVLAIEDFTPGQIQTFLRNRYGGDEQAARDRMELLAGVKDLLGLSRNPRMLGFIANLDDGRLASVAGAGGTFSAAALYREILESWLDFEERRTQGVPGAPVNLRHPELWAAVSRLAFQLWESGESYLRLAELAEVASELAGLAESRLSSQQAMHAVGAGSLLVRTDDGLFGFIHTSVMEWLVAEGIAAQFNRGEDPAALAVRPLSPLTVEFLGDLADPRRCTAWTARVLGDENAGETVRANALRLSARLRLPDRADLRGASLRGEDLSHRELARADLTGADLSATRLVATNLTEARLEHARLRGARLDQTHLDGVDLRDADLAGARLFRADLRDARITGSSWRRAALIDVVADAALLRAPELRGAVVAPGRPVVPGLWPSAVGVSFGFEVGRLPIPVAYSPDGAVLAVGSDDGGVLICDTMTGLPVRTLQGHRGRVYAVRFDAASHQLVTGAADLTVRLWDADHGDVRHVIEDVFAGWVWPLLIDGARGRLVVGDAAGVVRLYDTRTARLRQEWTGHAAPIWGTSFSPDGRRLVVADSAGVLSGWDVASGTLAFQVREPEVVYRVVHTPDGQSLVAVGQHGRVWIRRAADGTLLRQPRGHEADVYALDVHPDGHLMATGDTHGALRLWEVATGRPVRALARQRGAIYSVRFNRDGTLLASAASDGAIQLWDTADGQPRHELTRHRGSVWPVAWRPDQQQVATSSNDGTTRLWDVRTGQCQHTLRGHGRRVTALSFRDDGGVLATCGNDGVVRLWEPRTGRLVRQLSSPADRLVSAVFCPGEPLLASPSGDGGVHLWNTDTGVDERELNVNTDHVWAAAFSPDGDALATANDDDTVRLWYRRTGRHFATLTPHRGRVRSVAFSPDGETIATGCDDRLVRLWDAATATCRTTLKQHTDRVYAVTYNAEGTLLASASNDGTAVIWDALTGERRTVLTEHSGRLWSCAFSPNGNLLATAGDDLTIRLWDPATGRLHGTLSAHTRRVWSVAFSPDSSLLASAGDDGTVRLWDVADPEHAQLRTTLIGLPDGWAAVSPDGRYKLDGDPGGQFWHVIGTCRFEVGELDPYLTQVRRLSVDAPF